MTALEYIDSSSSSSSSSSSDDGAGVWRVHSRASGPHESFDAVVMALPAHALRHLRVHVRGQRLPAATLDAAVEYVSLAVLLLAFPTHPRTAEREVRGR